MRADGRLDNAGFQLLEFNHRSAKWGAPEAGTGAVIRYAFLTAPLDRPGARNCSTMAPLAAMEKLPADLLRHEVRAAMKSWERASDVRFVPAPSAALADVVIGMQGVPHGIAYADVELSPANGTAVRTIHRGAICFNPLRAWEASFDGNPDTPDIRYVAAHELGHVLGLNHSWRRGEPRLMDFHNREVVRGPQVGDAAGAAFLYGRPLIRDAHVIPSTHVLP